MSFYNRSYGAASTDVQTATVNVQQAANTMNAAIASGDPSRIVAANDAFQQAQAALAAANAAPTITGRTKTTYPATSIPSRSQVEQALTTEHGTVWAPQAPPSDSAGLFDSVGPWIWIVPAGVVAVAIGAYFYTHRKGKMAGYRRRRRSRR